MSLQGQRPAESGAARRTPRIFHLSTTYLADESRPGYAFSGSSARTRAVLHDVSAGLGLGVHAVRMRSPFRAPTSSRGLLELRFTVRSALGRVPLGGAGRLGPKRPLALMEYLTNGFDASPLFGSLGVGGGDLVILDHLSAFSYLGWGKKRGKGLKTLYLSHDYEPEFVRERYLSSVVRKRIDSALGGTDLLVAASERDRLAYLSHGVIGEDQVMVYPNIFPPGPGWEGTPAFERASMPFTLAMVETGWLGRKGAKEDAEFAAGALGLLPRDRKVRVLAFGDLLWSELRRALPGSIEVVGGGRVPGRDGFLRALSGAHAGVNLARWSGGTNVKKYDFALAGLVVLSNPLGTRGGLIPHEHAFSDAADLAADLLELTSQGSARVVRMGDENSRAVRTAAKGASESLMGRVKELFPASGGGTVG